NASSAANRSASTPITPGSSLQHGPEGGSPTPQDGVFRLLSDDDPASLGGMSLSASRIAGTDIDPLRRRVGFWLRNDAARLLWPGRCLTCGEAAGDAIDLCPACLAGLPWLGPACPRCALPLPG